MPDPYVGWGVFLWNLLFWGPICLIWWIVEKVRDSRDRRRRFEEYQAEQARKAAGESTSLDESMPR